MPLPAITVDSLSKVYRLGAKELQHETLYGSILDVLSSPVKNYMRVRRLTDFSNPDASDVVWALRDVSLEIAEGEVVGIIGKNGAGKSTLLKILSRITEPTSGRVVIRGRVGSLLEVGTGFHPDLTGKENIYLNGTILGMKKKEVDRKFDDIVDFSGISRFIETPVKRYSSGMRVRLAFSVAAHLDPEILIIDEVLAVGDAEFQRRCLGKMDEAAKSGRTILFVSHSMGAISRLCGRTVLLEDGSVKYAGATEEVIQHYLSGIEGSAGQRTWSDSSSMPGNENMKLTAVTVRDSNGSIVDALDIRKPFSIEVSYVILQPLSVRVGIRVLSQDGTVVFSSSDAHGSNPERTRRLKGTYTSKCHIPGNLLNRGFYSLTVTADVPFVEWVFKVENTLGFQIVETGGVAGQYPDNWPGVICPILIWETESAE